MTFPLSFLEWREIVQQKQNTHCTTQAIAGVGSQSVPEKRQGSPQSKAICCVMSANNCTCMSVMTLSLLPGHLMGKPVDYGARCPLCAAFVGAPVGVHLWFSVWRTFIQQLQSDTYSFTVCRLLTHRLSITRALQHAQTHTHTHTHTYILIHQRENSKNKQIALKHTRIIRICKFLPFGKQGEE